MDQSISNVNQMPPTGGRGEHGAPSRGTRKDATEHRCRILEVARNLFQQCGVESVSMHQIAKAAGVGQGTLYRRYAHKGDLCMDVLKESVEEFLEQMESWIAESQGKLRALDILDNVIERIVDFTEAKAHLLTVIQNSLCVDENHAEFEHVLYSRLHETVTTLLDKVVEQYSPGPLDVSLTADILISALNPKFYMFERKVRGYSKEQITDGIRRIYLAGVLSGHTHRE